MDQVPTSCITVLGAGLQGSCVALGLARRGHRVVLLEQRPAPMNAASLRNEGKIHLGFVYALDSAGTTAHRMLEGALSFAPLLDELCGSPLPWHDWRSESFRYAVMPSSLASPEALETAYARLAGLIPEVVERADRPLHYLGRKLGFLWRPAADRRGRPCVGGRLVEPCYETEEASIDPRLLAATLRERLETDPRIELRCGVRVRHAQRCPGGFRLDLETGAGAETRVAPLVVNCTWSDRARLDRDLDIEPPAPLSYRVKYQVLVRLPAPDPALAPVTMVQGPYGDVVPRRDGSVYLSWYPHCRTYFGSEPPPAEELLRTSAPEVAHETVAALSRLFPALAGAEILSSLPGIIVAPGDTDVDDPSSGLHRRDSFGPSFHDGWCTVDTGKLTTAPFNADRLVQRIDREIRAAAA